MDSYHSPNWIAQPTLTSWIEVIKSGVIIEHISLMKKGEYFIGRLPSKDLSLDHQSVSRNHAVLMFNSASECFLMDQGSSHGTFLNKKQIKPHMPVRLTNGSSIRFGASSRLYVFQQPEETFLDSSIMQKSSLSNESNIEPEILVSRWFEDNKMPMEIKVLSHPEEEEKFTASLQISISDSQDEICGSGSTLDAAKDELFVKAIKFLKDNGLLNAKRRLESVDLSDSDDADEFYDRTLSNPVNQSAPQGKMETFESLQQQKAVLFQEKLELEAKLNDLEVSEKGNEVIEDSLDLFMKNVDTDLQTQLKQDIAIKINKIDAKLIEIEKLLNFLMPKKATSDEASTKINLQSQSSKYGLQRKQAHSKSTKKKYTVSLAPENFRSTLTRADLEEELDEQVPTGVSDTL